MAVASREAELRSRIRWRRSYRADAEGRPEDYATRLTPSRMSLLLGSLPDFAGDPVATVWVQRPRSQGGPTNRGQDPDGPPEFAGLIRKGHSWHQVGSFGSVSAVLDALSKALPENWGA